MSWSLASYSALYIRTYIHTYIYGRLIGGKPLFIGAFARSRWILTPSWWTEGLKWMICAMAPRCPSEEGLEYL